MEEMSVNTTTVTVHYKEFITIHVDDAQLRTTENEKYTVYSVTLKTNSLSFAAPHTRVCRRYNDFLWLQRRLKKIPRLIAGCNVPSLPRRQLPIWNFDDDFLHKRKEALQEFLSRSVKETLFLSSSAFHLFIQTELSVSDMEEVISKGQTDKAISDHVRSVEVDGKFLETLRWNSRDACDSPADDSSQDIDPRAARKGQSAVYWRCRHNTMKKVASLPHFSTVLKQYDVIINNNADNAEQ